MGQPIEKAAVLLHRAKESTAAAHDEGMPHILVVSEASLERMIFKAAGTAPTQAPAVSIAAT